MARVAENGRVWIHMSQMIEVTGEMENGHELKIRLGTDQARILQAALNFADQMEDGHLSHAFYHARNPEYPFPCPQCRMPEAQ